jgi:hypothetical protein
MTGPKDDAGAPGQKLGGWQPLVCAVCGEQITERNPAKAVEQLEIHLAVAHGIDV